MSHADEPYVALAGAVVQTAIRDLQDPFRGVGAARFLLVELWESDNLWGQCLGHALIRRPFIHRVARFLDFVLDVFSQSGFINGEPVIPLVLVHETLPALHVVMVRHVPGVRTPPQRQFLLSGWR